MFTGVSQQFIPRSTPLSPITRTAHPQLRTSKARALMARLSSRLRLKNSPPDCFLNDPASKREAKRGLEGQAHLVPDHVTVSGIGKALVLISESRIESDQPIFAGEHQAFTAGCTSVFNDFPHECTGATAMLILRRSIHAEKSFASHLEGCAARHPRTCHRSSRADRSQNR